MALVKYNNRSILNVTALDSVPTGDLNLLATNTITSGVSSSSFTSNIDSTYDTYMFKFINMHPASNSQDFQFNLSTDSGSSYNVTKTSTYFRSFQYENDAAQNVQYQTNEDLAQSTNYQNLCDRVGNGNDESCSGTLFLFSPSNTTFVKHFISTNDRYFGDDAVQANDFVGGYGNTTSAVNAIDFKFASGNIDSGVIKMYGLSKS
jgi:hypothetical protein|tara:strand:+ start:407 stop:1021 length:615 start_codon:yes stop_codon:yes gene_type:complete